MSRGPFGLGIHPSDNRLRREGEESMPFVPWVAPVDPALSESLVLAQGVKFYALEETPLLYATPKRV